MLGERLERAHSQVPPILGLGEDPVVVPVGEELLGEQRDRRGVEVRFELSCLGIEKPVCEGLGLAQVDGHPLGESQRSRPP